MGSRVRLLLDTCTFLWLAQEPARLGPRARTALDDHDNQLLLSHVSVWEMYNKAAEQLIRQLPSVRTADEKNTQNEISSSSRVKPAPATPGS